MRTQSSIFFMFINDSRKQWGKLYQNWTNEGRFLIGSGGTGSWDQSIDVYICQQTPVCQNPNSPFVWRALERRSRPRKSLGSLWCQVHFYCPNWIFVLKMNFLLKNKKRIEQILAAFQVAIVISTSSWDLDPKMNYKWANFVLLNGGPCTR